uniref:Regulator of telomere elongation helicase 1 homolog n=2 Tax=Cacopsylla melanoneura TaxID=428564 RepID=A0A8D8SK57_9HEMI
MPEIEIRGIPVKFPYEPYDLQKEYMSKVIECLQTGKNGLLESPTGTGKTLCLLCATLAWQMAKKASIQAQRLGFNTESSMSSLEFITGDNNTTKWEDKFRAPRALYSSRTHSQLNQVLRELQKTEYTHVKVSTLGSRDQLCIHPDVSNPNNSGAVKKAMCRALVSNRSCKYYEEVASKVIDLNIEVGDIEDLVKKGKKKKCCPYFATKELQKSADVIFLPYNYLLDQRIRKTQEIELNNDVIILDEAHNVEKICEEAASVSLASSDLALCITEVTSVMEIVIRDEEVSFGGIEDASTKDFTKDDLMMLKGLLLELEKTFDEHLKLSEEGKSFDGAYIFAILGHAGLAIEHLPPLSELLYKLSQFVQAANTSQLSKMGAALNRFAEFIDAVSNSLGPARSTGMTDEFFRVFVCVEESKEKRRQIVTTKSTPKVVHFWCFNSGFAMKSLLSTGVHSIILTSGTLTPFSAVINELGIPLEVQLQNPHVIDKEQISVHVVKNGPNGKELKSVYATRDNTEHVNNLASTVLNTAGIVPGGLLVFFPSFAMMEKCMTMWVEAGMWTKISEKKPIFMETRKKEEMALVIEQYYEAVESTKGGILLAVFRGKVSEGLDFSNRKARGVIIFGVPYSPFKDLRIVGKKQYLDMKKKQNWSGSVWYEVDAMRGVNQALGRVIRHVKDYGVVLLCDTRYTSKQASLSPWLREFVYVNDKFGTVLTSLMRFFYSKKDMHQPVSSSTTKSGQFQASNLVSRRDLTSPTTPTQAVPNPFNTDLVQSYARSKGDSSSERLSDSQRTPVAKGKRSIFDVLDDEDENKPNTSHDLAAGPSGTTLSQSITNPNPSSSHSPTSSDIFVKPSSTNFSRPSTSSVARASSSSVANSNAAKKSKLSVKPLSINVNESPALPWVTVEEFFSDATKVLNKDRKKELFVFLKEYSNAKTNADSELNNFKTFIETLELHLPSAHVKTQHLHIAFRRFVSSEHRERFDEHCMEIMKREPLS